MNDQRPDEEVEQRARLQIALGYEAFAKQREFHDCRAKYRLFGGAAGPGKSKALLIEAILQANEIPGANTLLLRRTFPELEGSLLLYFRRDVPREFYRSFNEAKHTVTWHNGSTTRFGYSQSEHDIYQYQSGEYLFIGIDELTHFTLRQWQFLTSRNRCPVRESFPNMAGATNPGNIGHAWVKSLFIDKQPAAGMEPREYDPSEYAFISARVFDNPIYAGDSNYLKSLQQLPDFYRRAFLDGDWSVFAGQYFTNFHPARDVIRAEEIRAADWWPRWISVDWGFEHPAAAYWHTQAPPNLQEDQRHRPGESRTRECGNGPSANNAAVSPAGDADPSSRAVPRSSPPTRAASLSQNAAASPILEAGGSKLEAGKEINVDSSPDARHILLGMTASPSRTVTYREFVAQHLSPRVLAAQISERSRLRDGRAEKIDAIYLSPDAFARRTDEASLRNRWAILSPPPGSRVRRQRTTIALAAGC